MARPARSKLEVALDAAILELFPLDKLIHDKAIKVKGKTLFVDRVIERLNIAIEVDGRQHDEFVAHFHGDKFGFADSKVRDAAKESWLWANGYIVVRFTYKEKITAANLRTKIIAAQEQDT